MHGWSYIDTVSELEVLARERTVGGKHRLILTRSETSFVYHDKRGFSLLLRAKRSKCRKIPQKQGVEQPKATLTPVFLFWGGKMSAKQQTTEFEYEKVAGVTEMWQQDLVNWRNLFYNI